MSKQMQSSLENKFFQSRRTAAIGVHSDSESEQESNGICQVESGLTLMRDNYQIGLKKLNKLCNFLVTAQAWNIANISSARNIPISLFEDTTIKALGKFHINYICWRVTVFVEYFRSG